MIMGTVSAAASDKIKVDKNLLSTGKAGDDTAASNLWVATDRVSLIDVIKNFVNAILGLLAFIVTIMLIYGGFLMITAAGDDGKYQKWFTILKQAAIGVAIVLLSFVIVNFVFRLVTTTIANAKPASSSG